MPKKPIKLKLEFDPTGCTIQRREAIRKNRQPDEKEALDRAIAEYGGLMRRLFKQGFVGWYYVSNDTRAHEHSAQSFRTSERMEAFEAKRIAERTAKRKAAHA